MDGLTNEQRYDLYLYELPVNAARSTNTYSGALWSSSIGSFWTHRWTAETVSRTSYASHPSPPVAAQNATDSASRRIRRRFRDTYAGNRDRAARRSANGGPTTMSFTVRTGEDDTTNRHDQRWPLGPPSQQQQQCRRRRRGRNDNARNERSDSSSRASYDMFSRSASPKRSTLHKTRFSLDETLITATLFTAVITFIGSRYRLRGHYFFFRAVFFLELLRTLLTWALRFRSTSAPTGLNCSIPT